MVSKEIPNIVITTGDFNGIGPEIILKTMSRVDLNTSTPIILAPVQVMDHYSALLSIEFDYQVISDLSDIKKGQINIFNINSDKLHIKPGIQSVESGKIAMKAIETGIDACISGQAQALVTAPISKEAVNLAGYDIPGHTEFLADSTGTSAVLMMLVNDSLRVALVTTHIPVKDIATAISAGVIEEKIKILAGSLIDDFRITYPKIAVLGLNPHAGDGGIIGREEMDLITPTLEILSKNMPEIVLDGPFPADGFFGQKLYQAYDGILAMYHDQGLAPFKLLSFGKGVNFTAGLPIIRTSPDHGTAFNIAGKGIADPSSFKQAYKLALELSKQKLREN